MPLETLLPLLEGRGGDMGMNAPLWIAAVLVAGCGFAEECGPTHLETRALLETAIKLNQEAIGILTLCPDRSCFTREHCDKEERLQQMVADHNQALDECGAPEGDVRRVDTFDLPENCAAAKSLDLEERWLAATRGLIAQCRADEAGAAFARCGHRFGGVAGVKARTE